MTVRLVVAVNVPDVAVTVIGTPAGVTARAFRNARFPPGVVVTDAMAGLATDQVTAPVMSRVTSEAPLLKEPVAVMRTTVSLARLTVAGEMVKLVRLPPVTLRVVVPLIPPRVAVITVVPCKKDLAAPPVVGIVATSGLDELQTA